MSQPEPPPTPGLRRTETWLLLGLIGLGALLLATSLKGVVLIDENSSIVSIVALRQGRLTVAGTEGLSPSPELLYFDPNARLLGAVRSPVPTVAPPLHAPLALPFAVFGWYGLVALNVLCFLGCGAMAFLLAHRHSPATHASWLALATVLLGGYSVEYAQGVWPHMIAAACATGAFLLAGRLRDGGPTWLGLLAGLLAGLATGMRYQNLVLAGAVGLGLLLWGPRRLRASLAYGLGLAGPLLACVGVNWLRHGWLNPVQKHPGYLRLNHGPRVDPSPLEPLHVLWAKVVDFSHHPPFQHADRGVMAKVQSTGAFLYLGALKKAWIQSAPWILLSLGGLIHAWWPSATASAPRQRELRALSLVVGAVLLLFSLTGFNRNDGLCFNQRYFLELVPLCAVALAWLAEGAAGQIRPLLLGGLLGGLLVFVPLRLPAEDTLRQLVLLKAPLLLAALLLLAWIAARAGHTRRALPLLLGACLAWSAGVHLGDDLLVSREIRRINRDRGEIMAHLLPRTPAAVFAHFVNKDALGPLQLDRDLVIADVWIDEGRTAPRLARELLQRGRRVFILGAGFPERIFRRLVEGHRVHVVARAPLLVLELLDG